MPTHAVGQVGGVRYVLGRAIGADTRVVDVHATLAPWERRDVNLAAAAPLAWQRGPLPANVTQWFGGPLTVAGTAADLLWVRPDGAGYSAQFRARNGRTFVTDVWLTWYPDQPGWCTGEAVVTSSNPTVPDVSETIPPGFDLAFGDAVVVVTGAGNESPLVPAGTKLADGQARAVPVTVVWARHLHSATQWSSANAAMSPGIAAVGIERLLPTGNPVYPSSFSPLAWTAERFTEAARRLHTWEPGVCGPAPFSGISGEQTGEQVFVRGEPLLPNGLGAEAVTWLSGLKMFGRPCHYLDANGAPIRWQDHPHCVMWAGRPHWSTVISPDQLGAATLTTADTTFAVPPTSAPNGSVLWSGPDNEHWMINTVAAGARLTGSFALQRELESQATLYLLTDTVPSLKPGWSTNVPGAARAVGYAGMLATRLWQDLEDRALAADVAQRWQRRVAEVYLPQLGSKPNAVWDVRYDDVRLGPGARWLPWQQALGAYGLDEACAVANLTQGRQLALAAAKAVLRDAYVKRNGLWTTRDVVALDGSPVGEGFYDLFACPLAVAVVLRHEPANVQAREIWNQLQWQCVATKHTSWLAPGIV